MEMRLFVLGKSSKVQEPNAETDHASGVFNTSRYQAQQIYENTGVLILGSTLPGETSAGMHFFIKKTRWAGVLSVPKAGTHVQF